MESITITKPDDWHLHLRDADHLNTTVLHAAKRFERAVVMPNLKAPVTSVAQALEYRQRILAALPEKLHFNPLMALYLTDNTGTDMVKQAKENVHIIGFKLYPAGATTNSEHGITKFDNVFNILEALSEHNVPLLIHGEVTDPSVDIFDREKIFIDTVLAPMVEKFPKQRFVLEHMTTKDAVDFIQEAPSNVAATITAHHLLSNRNDMLVGGIKPHYYCLPVLKRKLHQEALIAAATSGDSKFFLGTDSAPHSISAKQSACGCAGVYTAHAALELYAEVFDAANALDKLERFASFNGADFYGFARNTSQVTLSKQEWDVPASYPFGDDVLVPFRAGETVSWELSVYS